MTLRVNSKYGMRYDCLSYAGPHETKNRLKGAGFLNSEEKARIISSDPSETRFTTA